MCTSSVFAFRILVSCHSPAELTAAIDETSSAYSSFCTQHCPDEYEQRLTQVTSVSQPAKIKWSQERRHGKSRVDFEEELVSFDALRTS